MPVSLVPKTDQPEILRLNVSTLQGRHTRLVVPLASVNPESLDYAPIIYFYPLNSVSPLYTSVYIVSFLFISVLSAVCENVGALCRATMSSL